MLRTFSPDDLIEVNGKYVEKEYAFPDLEGDQKSLMLNFVDGEWVLSLWNAAVDDKGTEACGWEPVWTSSRAVIADLAKNMMADIERGE